MSRESAPGGDVIKAFLPDGPAPILMDELLNYISRERQRKSGQSDQLYHFVQNLSEETHGCSNVVLCVSIPASELEMTPEDHRDYEAIKKLLDRLGKAVIMSTGNEIAEIIRRRLFDWGGLPDDAKITASSYAKWVIEHKQMVGDFDVDSAHDRFLASYPFHPALLSVVAVHTTKANVQYTTAGGKARKSAKNRHEADMLMNTSYDR